MEEIKYKLNESEKDMLRLKLESVLNQKEGMQAIILIDKDGIRDYYQNICVKCLLELVEEASIDYARQTNNELIVDNYDEYLDQIMKDVFEGCEEDEEECQIN